MSKVEIKKIVIDLDGKELMMDLEKAKRLYEALSQLFPSTASTYHICNHTCHHDWWNRNPWTVYTSGGYTTAFLNMNGGTNTDSENGSGWVVK